MCDNGKIDTDSIISYIINYNNKTIDVIIILMREIKDSNQNSNKSLWLYLIKTIKIFFSLLILNITKFPINFNII